MSALTLVVACSVENDASKSEDVVDVQTFDQMMEAKEEGKAVSEFDLCGIEAKKYSAFKAECKGGKLAAKGYTDGVDCIMKTMTGTPEEQELCGDSARYNAEVQATNECQKLKKAELPEGIKPVKPFDCIALMGK